MKKPEIRRVPKEVEDGIITLLKEEAPEGIVVQELLDKYQKRFGSRPNPTDYGFQLTYDMIKTFGAVGVEVYFHETLHMWVCKYDKEPSGDEVVYEMPQRLVPTKQEVQDNIITLLREKAPEEYIVVQRLLDKYQERFGYRPNPAEYGFKHAFEMINSFKNGVTVFFHGIVHLWVCKYKELSGEQ